jgi:hypothetical protein
MGAGMSAVWLRRGTERSARLLGSGSLCVADSLEELLQLVEAFAD